MAERRPEDTEITRLREEVERLRGERHWLPLERLRGLLSDAGKAIEGCARLPRYHRWVIQKLVRLGLEGVSEPDLVATIIRDWIKDHADEHRRYGISREAYLQDQKVATVHDFERAPYA